MAEKIDIYPNFISVSDEAALLNHIQWMLPGGKSASGGRNAILRFGSSAPYSDHMISEVIPEWLAAFSNRIEFDHVSINEYLPGQEIPWHVDSKGSGEVISVLSLCSDAVMKFRRMRGIQIENFTLPARSLTQFSGPLRYEWEHYLRANQKRFSIVFRKSTT